MLINYVGMKLKVSGQVNLSYRAHARVCHDYYTIINHMMHVIV